MPRGFWALNVRHPLGGIVLDRTRVLCTEHAIAPWTTAMIDELVRNGGQTERDAQDNTWSYYVDTGRNTYSRNHPLPTGGLTCNECGALPESYQVDVDLPAIDGPNPLIRRPVDAHAILDRELEALLESDDPLLESDDPENYAVHFGVHRDLSRSVIEAAALAGFGRVWQDGGWHSWSEAIGTDANDATTEHLFFQTTNPYKGVAWLLYTQAGILVASTHDVSSAGYGGLLIQVSAADDHAEQRHEGCLQMYAGQRPIAQV